MFFMSMFFRYYFNAVFKLIPKFSRFDKSTRLRIHVVLSMFIDMSSKFGVDVIINPEEIGLIVRQKILTRLPHAEHLSIQLFYVHYVSTLLCTPRCTHYVHYVSTLLCTPRFTSRSFLTYLFCLGLRNCRKNSSL